MAKFTVYYVKSPFGLLSTLSGNHVVDDSGKVILDRDDFTVVVEGVEFPTLETLFRDMNAVDGDETCCRLKVRSMSTGDVAEDQDGNLHQCAIIGWKKATWKKA